MFFSLRKLMPQLLICVILEERHNVVRTHNIKNGQIIEMDEKTFDSQDRLIGHIQSLIKDTQLYYLSVFFSDVSQGIFLDNICNKQNEMKDIQYLNINNMQIYASLKSIEHYKKIFANGVDFIFSPFALLYYCVQKEKILNQDLTTLCVYKHSDCIVVVIFKGDKVVFGSFFETRMKEFPEIASDENKNEVLEEDLELNLDEEYDVKELDSMLKDKLEQLEEQQHNEKLEDFGNDMAVCRYIISSIEEFYNNPNYKSDFIDEFVIFDNENITKATLEYMENELFLTPQVIKIDTLDLMNELMRKELKI